MTDITISPEAIEAAAIELAPAPWSMYTEDAREHFRRKARAAIHAALKAWPGMQHDPGALVTDAYRDPGKIILPLPTEKTDD